MPLLDACRKIRGDIERRDELLRESKKAEVFSERAQELATMRSDLTSTIGRIRVFLDYGIVVEKVRDPGAALERLRNYKEKLVQSPTESGKDHGITKKALDRIKDALDTAAKEALEAVIRKIPTTDETFLKQVELNPLYRRQVEEIRAARIELQREHPQDLDAAGLQSFLKKHDALREKASQLNPTEFPKEVLEFFKAARGTGAPLERLTPSVRQWFEDRGQLKNIRVNVVDD
jgi:hypothetical protein